MKWPGLPIDIQPDTWQVATADYHRWIDEVEKPWRDALLSARNVCATKNDKKQSGDEWPLISVVMPTYETPLEFLREAIESVINQQYTHWQLCIADDASTDSQVKALIQFYLKQDSRITAVFRQSNGGIAAATNDALDLVRGKYIALLDHDDVLPRHSLQRVAEELRSADNIQILYTDSDNLDAAGVRCNPFFKPDWNYDLFLGQNYLNHMTVYRAELIHKLGGIRAGLDGSQDYDLALRAIECVKFEEIRHIPHILYHWRVVASSVSRSNLGKAVRAARNAIREHLQRTGQKGVVGAAPNAVIYNRVQWQIVEPPPEVLVVLYGEAEEQVLISNRIIREKTSYKNFTVKSVVSSKSGLKNKVLGGILNAAVEHSEADILCFIYAGCKPNSPDWLDSLVGNAMRPLVGSVTAKTSVLPSLLKARGLGGCDESTKIVFSGVREDSKGYFSHFLLDQRILAAHGSCVVTRRKLFCAFSGFDPSLPGMAQISLDYSSRLSEEKYASIWSAATILKCSEDADNIL